MPRKKEVRAEETKKYKCPECGRDFTNQVTPATLGFWCMCKGECTWIEVREQKSKKKGGGK